MKHQIEFVICPCCKAKIPKTKFCNECGYELKEIKSIQEEQTTNNKKPLNDEGLTLLVNVCKKTNATVGGDEYQEIVLYVDDRTNEYWLHTYSKHVYMINEKHASYVASSLLAEKIFKYIEDNNVISIKDNKGFGLCGCDYILKFKYKDEVVRLDSSNMNGDFKAYYDINNILQSEIKPENRRYTEE